MIIILYGFLYAFFGWMIEVIYYAFKTKRFVNRGFLHGPFVPIYGLSMLTLHGLFVLIFGPSPALTGWVIGWTFIVIAGVATLLEIVGGAALWHGFGLRWWDYSDNRFNYKGYACLSFSLIWGVFGTTGYLVIHRGWMAPLMERLSLAELWGLGAVLLGYLVIDLALTLRALTDFSRLVTELRHRSGSFQKATHAVRNRIPESVSVHWNHYRRALEGHQPLQVALWRLEKLKESLGKVKDRALKQDFDTLRFLAKKVVSTRLFRAFPGVKIAALKTEVHHDEDPSKTDD